MAKPKRAQSAGVESTADRLLEGLNPEQREVVLHDKGALLVGAVAGAGKTTALVRRIAYLVVAREVDGRRVLAVTFSKKAADEMNDRLVQHAPGCDARVGTFHSLALQFCREELNLSGWEIDDRDRYRSVVKDALGFRGMKWESADLTTVLQYIGLCKAKCAPPGTDAARAVAKQHYDHQPCGQRNPTLLHEAYQRAEVIRTERRLLTFDDMLLEMWKALSDDEMVRSNWGSRWDYVLQDEGQDESLVQREIARFLASQHGNYMVVGDPAQCHPPGVQIEVEKGVSLPIEKLADGQSVRGWNRNAQRMLGGRVARVAVRQYDGAIHDIVVGDRSVPMTSNHKVLARWTDRGSDTCVTYLMYRAGLGYRVGWCKLFAQSGVGSIGFHLATRCRLEKAEAVWVLRTHDSRTDASVYESVIAAGYGLPTATFEPVNGAQHQTREAINRIFTDPRVASRNGEVGERCLRDHGLECDLPIYPFPPTETDEPASKHRRATYFPVYAVNVLPGLMSLPLPDATNAWAPVQDHAFRSYTGPVYSLDVENDHAYAANGVVVLNSIYGFRGADPTGMLQFESQWSARVIHMSRNYRCGDAIVVAANRSLASMTPGSHLGMQILGERGEPGSVVVTHEADADAEATTIASRIKELAGDGMTWAEMATLYRTNAQSRALEEVLLKERIPYVVIGGTNFYDRKEVKDLLGYLRIASGRGRWDDVRRCLNAPFRFLGKAFLDRVAEECEVDDRDTRDGGASCDVARWTGAVRHLAERGGMLQQRQRVSAIEWCELLDAMARTIDARREELAKFREMRYGMADSAALMTSAPSVAYSDEDDEVQRERFIATPERLLENLLDETGYIKWLTRDEGTESPENNRVSNVRELVRAASRFATVDDLLDYIDETVAKSKDNKLEGTGDPQRVTLMTIHRSKGLEWRAVFVIGCSEKILPHGRTVDIDEERRLFYVACTRARDVLSLTSIAAVDTSKTALLPSRFLAEVGL